MRTFNVTNQTKFLSIIGLICISLNPLFSQQILQPITSLSLVATPTLLLERESSINDIEITSTNHLDTLIINQFALFTGYVKNSSDVIFDAQIDINFNLNQLEDVDFENMDENLTYDADASVQLSNVSIQPGDSVLFYKFINIDPGEIDPNSNGVIIIWPEFRIAPNEQNVEPGYAVDMFYASGIIPEDHSGGKSLNSQQSSFKINNVSLNSFNKLQQHLAYNNYDATEIILTSIDGKIILQQNQLPQQGYIKNMMSQHNSSIILLKVVAEKLNAKPEIITIKLHQGIF